MSEPHTEPNPAPPPADDPNAAMMDDHNYDGIQEYDNPIPGWWKWLFVATIVFTPIYILWFHAPGMERDLLAQYDRAFASNLERRFGEIGELSPDAATIMRYIDDEKWLAVGVSTYQTHCVVCHGSDAQGAQGPNLTDDVYLNVTQIEDVADVIAHGANNGAMPAWGTRLHPNAVVLTASYVASLRGTNAPGGKAPEGNEIPPWTVE